MAQTLEEFRFNPGTFLKDLTCGRTIMVIEMCAGMTPRDGRPSGGAETVAVVSMETGRTSFVMGDTPVEKRSMNLVE